MFEPEDLFVYAAKRVANKPVMQRVWHSSKLHIIRSGVASEGSAGSKAIRLGGAALRASFGLIPIPVVGSLASMIENRLETWRRECHYEKRLGKAQEGTAEHVKFELKSLNLEDIDRYRWKVEQTMKDLNTALGNHPSNFIKKRNEGAECDAYYELALAAEQATRRINKLRTNCLAVKKVMEETLAWLDECEYGKNARPGEAQGGVSGKKNDILDELRGHVSDFLPFLYKDPGEQETFPDHAHCKHWCWRKDLAEADTFAGARDIGAKIIRVLSSPFTIEQMGEPLMGVRDIFAKK